VSPVFCGGAHLCFVYLKDSGSAHLCFINLKDGGGAPLILDGLCEIPLVSNQLPAVLPPSEHWRWLTLYEVNMYTTNIGNEQTSSEDVEHKGKTI
jgi:hypothetical protein